MFDNIRIQCLSVFVHCSLQVIREAIDKRRDYVLSIIIVSNIWAAAGHPAPGAVSLPLIKRSIYLISTYLGHVGFVATWRILHPESEGILTRINCNNSADKI